MSKQLTPLEEWFIDTTAKAILLAVMIPVILVLILFEPVIAGINFIIALEIARRVKSA